MPDKSTLRKAARRRYRRFFAQAAVVVFGITVTDFWTGLSSGLGIDMRSIGQWIGGKIKPGSPERKPAPKETGSITPPAPPPKAPVDEEKKKKEEARARAKAKCQREKEAELVKDDEQVQQAENEWNACLDNARRHLIKMFDPERYCEVQRSVKLAMEAQREVTKDRRC
jgi:type IV secretory pathway VirB10-like protein